MTSLSINEIELHNFRSYEKLQLQDLGRLTIFVGPNAVGKTNIIEAIQLLTALSSFRGATANELIKNGTDEAKISAHATNETRDLTIAMAIEGRSRKYSLNGKAKKTSELKGLIPAVSFTPDDLTLIKGSPSQRRRAIDQLGSQLNPNYHTIVRDFEKVLRHKNRLLKDEAPAEYIEAVNELFLRVGSELTAYRSALFNRILPLIKNRYAALSSEHENLDAAYLPSWLEGEDKASHDDFEKIAISRDDARERMQVRLSEVTPEEMRRKHTLVGPNLDQISFTINDMDAATFASQGQQRSIVLAWKLAEAELIEEMLGQMPVLLLDDVMSELDATRRDALVSYLERVDQAFITTANIDYFSDSMLERSNIINLPLKTLS